ncbi:MAG: hypothetical protein JW801_11985 [Bacteroidales bacterium]|nr:hypothetical protein [Bacteroidales bacterium]
MRKTCFRRSVRYPVLSEVMVSEPAIVWSLKKPIPSTTLYIVTSYRRGRKESII